jgi:hypothetical protein
VVLVIQAAAASAMIALSSARTGAPAAQSAPWAEPGVSVLADGTSVRLVSMGGPRTDTLLTRVRAEIGDAVGAVERFWGTDWTREIVLVATATDAQFAAAARLEPLHGWADIAAVAVADEVDLVNRESTGQRIVLAPGASAMGDAALRIVLAHELFHLAARNDTALDAPRWLTEGVADFVARPTAPVPADAAANTALPSDAELDQPGPARSAGYDRAWWFARFVSDTYGQDGLRLLYARACGPGHGDFGTAVRQALGADLPEVARRWASWLAGWR